jgi:hypothetical protein
MPRASFDCNGSLTPRQGDALVKRGGVVIDTNPTFSKFMRSLFSRRHKFVFGSPSTKILQEIVDLAAGGKLPIPIGRTASLDEGIALICDLETVGGRRARPSSSCSNRAITPFLEGSIRRLEVIRGRGCKGEFEAELAEAPPRFLLAYRNGRALCRLSAAPRNCCPTDSYRCRWDQAARC